MAAAEVDLAALGVHRIAIPIPFAAAGGPVNLYVLEAADGSLTLFDAGFGSEEALAALRAGFAALGRSLAEVRRVIISHGHVDHFGAARFVQEQGGEVEVLAHPADHGKLDEAGPAWSDHAPRTDAHLARLGVPAEVRAVVLASGARAYGSARRVRGTRPIGEGALVEGRHLTFTVRHFPGHTPGLLALHAPSHGLLLSADHLLERVSPNPLMELGPDGRDGHFRPLVTYLASLERTRALDLALVLPGHGAPFGGHRGIIDGLLAYQAKRQARLAAALTAGPQTAWALCLGLFPAARPAETYLTMSETMGNLEVLEAEGRVVREEEGGLRRYRLTGAAPG